MIASNDLFARMHGLSEEQGMLRETLADYTDQKIIPNRETLDTEAVYPMGIHGDMLELGVLAMAIPEEYGGLGMGAVETAVVYEELARGCAGVATGIGANSLGADPILVYGTHEQKQRYLSKVAGGTVAAYAITEPNAGSDAGGIRTIAEPCDDGTTWKLKGQKTFITNAGCASIYTIFALTDPSRGPRGASCFIFEIDADNPPPGIQFPKKFDKMGINASETREIILDGFEVKTEDIIGGKAGRGFLQAMGVFDVSRPMIGTIGVGLAQSAFDAALTYAHQRVQFGKPIIEFQGLRAMFVDMFLVIEGARAMVFGGARMVDRKFHAGERIDVTLWSALAKIWGSEASRVTLDALQATGGYGYMNETPFPKMVRDHKILEIFEGTNQIQREQAGRQVMQEHKKRGTAIPEDCESMAKSAQSGGSVVTTAWKLVDHVIGCALGGDDDEALTARQDVIWSLGEMTGYAESARFLVESCARSGEDGGHWIHSLGQAYAREAVQQILTRAERLLRAKGEPSAAANELCQEARATAQGLFEHRDRLAALMLEATP